MDSNAPTLTEEANQLRRDIERLKIDLRQLRADLSGVGQDAVATARIGAAEAYDLAERRVRAAAARGRESIHAVEDRIATHPFTSLAGSLAVGVLLGAWITRSK